MKHTHHLPSPEFLFFPIHLSYATGKWPHPVWHFLTPYKKLPFCFLVLQDRSSHETLSVLPVWHKIVEFYHFLYADWPGKPKQELYYIFISKANLQECLYRVFSLSDAVCPHLQRGDMLLNMDVKHLCASHKQTPLFPRDGEAWQLPSPPENH